LGKPVPGRESRNMGFVVVAARQLPLGGEPISGTAVAIPGFEAHAKAMAFSISEVL
jgi:hypothetical protein